MASIYDWSTTADNNATADSSINWPEGMPPASVNDSARVMMKRVKELVGDIGGSLTAGGTADALTLTVNSAFTSLANGLVLSFRAASDNTGAVTFNVNSLGTKAIRKMTVAGDAALGAGDIQATGIYVVQYSTALNSAAGAWQLLNPTIDAATKAGTETLTNKTFPDASTTFVDDGDATKALKFQLSGFTTATTRTVTWPDASGTVMLSAQYPTIVSLEGLSLAQGDILYATGADTLARLAKGTAGQALHMNTGATAPTWVSGGGAPDAVLEDQKNTGVSGGTATSGAWQTRTLNTKVRDPFSFIALSSNQFTPTVDGWVEWSAPAYRTRGHQTRLYNVTNSAEVALGSSENSDAGDDVVTISVGGGAVVAGKTYRLEHRVNTTAGTTGFGGASGFGSIEVYARVKFWRSI